MPMVRAYATMAVDLETEVFIPDNIPEDEWGEWVKENVDGGSFYDADPLYGGDWEWNTFKPERID